MRQGVFNYLTEHSHDFVAGSPVYRNGEVLEKLICRICDQTIGARVDRIKGHLGSKRHQKAMETAHAQENHPSTSDEPVDRPRSRRKSIPRKLAASGQDVRSERRSSTAEEPNDESDTDTDAKSQMETRSESQSRYEPNSPPPAKRFCVKWGEHGANCSRMFSEFRVKGAFTDVTLWCEGEGIPCHKIVLAAGSACFEKCFKESPENYSVFVVTGLKMSELRPLLDFMYTGEMDIEEEQFCPIMRAGKELQVRRLCNSVRADGEMASNRTSASSSNETTTGVKIKEEFPENTNDFESPGKTSAAENSDYDASPVKKFKKQHSSTK